MDNQQQYKFTDDIISRILKYRKFDVNHLNMHTPSGLFTLLEELAYTTGFHDGGKQKYDEGYEDGYGRGYNDRLVEESLEKSDKEAMGKV